MLEHAPVEQPGSGELLVAVEATGIAFAEQSMRRGRYFGQPAFPFTRGTTSSAASSRSAREATTP